MSLHTRRRSMHLIWVAGHLGVRLPATPPPLPRRNGRVNPGPVPVHRALPRTKAPNSCCCTPTGMSTTRSKKRAEAVGSRLSPTTAHELQDLHDPRRPPYQWRITEKEPWESASAPRQADSDLQGPSPLSRRNSVRIPSRCRLTQCMYPLWNQA